jgi:hypothetical protein
MGTIDDRIEKLERQVTQLFTATNQTETAVRRIDRMLKKVEHDIAVLEKSLHGDPSIGFKDGIVKMVAELYEKVSQNQEAIARSYNRLLVYAGVIVSIQTILILIALVTMVARLTPS